ncbi:MAG: hypothetical protein BMS9Abin08_1215 [Gammaproteobacteria bacterium]|nr:MAG: hypothetical protein BMS9Abin08_1215 [Gammaproteobacteria bacterium]
MNRAEVMFREGQYLESPDFPSKLGYEASGVIEAVGPDVSDFKVGDRISTTPAFSMGKYGVYGERAIVPARAAAKYPATLSAAEGAAIWMQYITAFGGLIEVGKLTPGATVVITAASPWKATALMPGLSVVCVRVEFASRFVATPQLRALEIAGVLNA